MTVGHMPSPRTGFSSIKNGRVVRFLFYANSSDVEKAARVLQARGLRIASQGPNFLSYYGTPSKREQAMLARHEDVAQYNPKFRAIASAAFRAKFERCVKEVKRSGGPYNPWAVCTSSLRGYPKRNPGGPDPFDFLYKTSDHDARDFGSHFLGPMKLPPHKWTRVAHYAGQGDGHDADVYVSAAPAEFYRVKSVGAGVDLSTGSGMSKLVADLADAISRGMIGEHR
jgi:hypothetical protein